MRKKYSAHHSRDTARPSARFGSPFVAFLYPGWSGLLLPPLSWKSRVRPRTHSCFNPKPYARPRPPQSPPARTSCFVSFRKNFLDGAWRECRSPWITGTPTQLCLPSGGSWRKAATCRRRDWWAPGRIQKNTTCPLVAASGSVRGGKKNYFPVGSLGSQNILRVSVVAFVQTARSPRVPSGLRVLGAFYLSFSSPGLSGLSAFTCCPWL